MKQIALVAVLAAAITGAVIAQPAQAPPRVEYYRLVPGFLPEVFNDSGMATGTGFAAANPWGAYTAYLLATNSKGQRTWRIENYLPNAASGTAQGSTMYLFEGSERALLVDTANNTTDVPGQPDLKAVVRHLLGHQNDGSAKPGSVDFVVSNTHSHGDHTGKNSLMSDRTVYYPDLDWPRANVPANYVPIKEGGGASAHGTGQAVGEIALGGRTIVAIDVPEHTPGSTAYLDRENRMVATGDALGSAYVWAHFGFITQYAASVHHLQDVLRPFDHVDVLPAHFYQIKQGARGKAPLNGRPLDKTYVDDQARVADGILAGTLTSVPYRSVGRNTVIATVDSAQVVYSLGSLRAPGAPAPAAATYHVVSIPGNSTPATPDSRFGAVDRIGRPFFLIRDSTGNSMYLLVGSAGALLIGSGTGTPGLAPLVARLAGSVPVSIVALSDDPNQIGGLARFPGAARVYLPKGMAAPAGVGNVQPIGAGDTIVLDGANTPQPLALDVHPLAGHSTNGLTLIARGSRVLFSGEALGRQGADEGLVLQMPLSAFAAALQTWRATTDGKYDVLYTSRNYQWFTPPSYVDDVQKLVTAGIDGGSPLVASTALPGAKMIRSAGNADAVVSVVFP